MTKFLDNKYSKLYFKLINHIQIQSRIKNDGVYFEKHHIYPKSLFPELDKDPSNLILLTAREHFICHYLLCKMVYKNSTEWHQMIRAFTFMYSSNNLHRRYMNSKLYELARKNIGVIMSVAQSGEKNSQFGTLWIYSDALQHSIKIKLTDLDFYLNNGYKKGRKLVWKDVKLQELEKINKQIIRLTQRRDLLLKEMSI